MATFGVAFGLCVLLIPLVRRASFRLGRVSQPRQDRWHRRPTPMLGGVGIFLAVSASLLMTAAAASAGAAGDCLFDPQRLQQWGFLSGAVMMFVLGLWDDFRPLSPSAKLIGQISAATLVIFLGYRSEFFSPKIDNPILAQIPNILFTYLWLIGITNAINLLDNMDGLAGGIALITTIVLGYFFWRGRDGALLAVTLALAGALVGFLIYNFPPAKIFMGDSGSLFLGFILATLAIAHQRQQASNVLAVLGVPTLLFLLPILDTILVTFTRLMRGQSPAQGGRDHTSHRLIAFGLSERQTLLVLSAAALAAALTAAAIESMNYWLSLAVAPLVIVGLALLAAYLGRIKIVAQPVTSKQGRAIAHILEDLTYRRRIFEVGLDFIVISLAYYLAFLGRYGLVMNAEHLEVYLQTLPLALASSTLAFFAAGVYRGIWSYIDLDDLLRFIQAALGGAALTAALIFIFSSTELAPWGDRFPRSVAVFFALFLLLGLTATRLSFRSLDWLRDRRVRPDEQPVLIYGAGNAGELALRWIRSNPQLNYRVIGFLDDDPLRSGRLIHGIEVLGSGDQLEQILESKQVAGVILTIDDEKGTKSLEIASRCKASCSCWVRSLRWEFSLVDSGDLPGV